MIVYYHIPKCAGSTLRHEVFERHIPQDKIYIIGDDIPGDLDRLNNMSDEEQDQYQLVFGHICYGSFQHSSSREYITVLRHPVTRIYSLYDYIRRSRGHHLHDHIRDMSLADFLLSGVTSTADNAMVRQLCGEDRMQREPYDDMLIPFGEVVREHLEKAKDNLSCFSLYGIQEAFDHFVQRLCMLYHWPLQEFRQRNKSPNRRNISFGDWNLIESTNQLDMELYQWAVNYI